ncbi:Uncharacterized protein XB16_3059 [Leptospira santarosai]|uniref:Uncharacterized protein n=1 Tax=Leptospira santarosai TaxID=28183 RepID=A0A2P1QWR7_9LEPT|nr:Uncharacterized protein XB16_3059 [Leptospira santarosai]
MGPLRIVEVPPIFDKASGFFQIFKPIFIQTFVSHLTVKAFDESILSRLSGSSKMNIDSFLLRPFQKSFRSKLRTVVYDDLFR